jgi:drug/metabolite transporter (DMT)-like permease
MNWIAISLIPPLFWSFSCLFDEYLTKKNFNLSSFNFMLIQTAISFFPGLLLLLFHQEALSMNFLDIGIFSALGIFFSLCFIPYLIAVKEDGAGLVVPLFETLPLFIFFLAWLILGEDITGTQFFLCLFIVIIASLSMIDEVNGFRIKSLLLMILSCVMLAIYVVSTRFLLEQHHWLNITIWNYIGAGVISFIYIYLYRPARIPIQSILSSKAGIFTIILFLTQALCDVAANAIWILALSLAPAAGMVQTVMAVQPFYIIGLSAISFYCLPQIFAKPPKGKFLAWRIFCFILIAMGIGLLNLYTT